MPVSRRPSTSSGSPGGDAQTSLLVDHFSLSIKFNVIAFNRICLYLKNDGAKYNILETYIVNSTHDIFNYSVPSLGIEEDTIFDFDMTPNRGDCFSHLGIARELNIIENGKYEIEGKYYSLSELAQSKWNTKDLIQVNTH